ncbi:MAG: pentapeptide repeat-containing protein, partial [Myxococcota bacterium]
MALIQPPFKPSRPPLKLASAIACTMLLLSCSTFEEVDFAGAPPCDLRQEPVDCEGMDLQGFNLSRLVLRQANLQGTDLTQALLFEADLRGADLIGANLTQTNLTGAFVSDTLLDGVIWQDTSCPDGTNSDQHGGTCGGHLSDNQLSPCTIGPAANCANLDLSAVDLRYANLEGANLQEATLQGANLRGVNLRGAQLRGAVLTGVLWNHTTCPDGTNSDDHPDPIDPTLGSCGGHLNPTPIQTCTIGPGANCAGANLRGLDLRYANLEGANLEGADLEETNLQYARLQQANLLGADIDRADLSNTNLIDAVLLDASVSETLFNEAIWSGTTCPDGTNSDDKGDTCGGHWTSCPECDAQPGAQCPGAMIIRCDLRYANLESANLSNAEVQGTFLQYANLRNTTMGAIRLLDAIELAHADLTGARISNGAVLP